MKIIALLLLYITLSLAANGQPYQLEISSKNLQNIHKLFLRYFTPNGPVYDSAIVHEGRFSFRGNLAGTPLIARITDGRDNNFEVWLEEGKIKVETDSDLTVTSYSGTENQRAFSKLMYALRDVKAKNSLLDDEYEKSVASNDNERKDFLLNEKYPALFREKQKVIGDFIRKHPASLVSAYKFEEFAGDDIIDLSIVEPVFDLLDPHIKNHPRVKEVSKRITIHKLTAPGMDALDFSQNDTLGNPVNLSSFRGKFLLIDFWAGWCVPCRAENPHLKKMYASYQKAGLEILGVSLDGERTRWTGAIRDDQLTWPQVSDLQIFENDIAKKYGITSIPQNILIDPMGKIVAKNLRGSALEKKLEDIFKY